MVFKTMRTSSFFLIFLTIINIGCVNKKQQKNSSSHLTHLIVLDPGHFHAALLQKSMNEKVDSTVYVFAPDSPDVHAYSALIKGYNNRQDNPTGWNEIIYTGRDYLEKMISSKPGNVVVIAGNNKLKTNYIYKSVDAGLNVLADKPMVITKSGFNKLVEIFATAKKNRLLVYDIMTERYEITNLLQKAFMQMPEVFGTLEVGTLEDPAVSLESKHYFFKEVSGSPIVRPDWYFDVEQEGEGIVDVTTHLVDLVQWECFPEENLDYKKDIQILTAKRWATILTPTQFKKVTKKDNYPEFLKKDIKDSLLYVYANGEINYNLKGITVRVAVRWDFEAPAGLKDTYYSKMRGTKANLIIRQGKEQQFKPVLYIEPLKKEGLTEWKHSLEKAFSDLQKEYPGIELGEEKNGWKVIIPDQYKKGHEEHFALVIKKYIQYLEEGKMPEWEISNMLAKYYTTTEALEKALGK